VAVKRTSRRKTTRRSPVKPSRRNAPAAARQAGGSFASLKKKNALLARELNDALEQQTITSRELSEAQEQQAATSQVLGIISSSPTDLKPVFETILANATRLCEATHATLWLREGDGFRVSARHGPHPAGFVERRGSLFRPGPGLPFARAATTLQAVHVADMRTEQAYVDRDPIAVRAVEELGIRTLVAVPMLKGKQAVGVISVYRQEVRPFTDKQIALVTNFAKQAVIAIENARLLTELRESLEQQTATSELLKVIGRSTFDLKPVFETLIESAVKLCGATRGFIARFDGQLLRFAAGYNVTPELTEYFEQNPFPIDRHSNTGRAALERRTIHNIDVRADPEYTYGGSKVDPYRTVLAIPMLKEDAVLGVILIYRHEVLPFTDNQIALVETFADQAVIAIENVRLFDEVQARSRELSESLEQQTATAEVLKVISRSKFDLQPVLDALTESAVKLCQAQDVQMHLRDGERYRIVASYGFMPGHYEYAKQHPPPLGRGSALGRAVQEAQVVHIPDVLADPEYMWHDAQKRGGFRAVLAVPLLREGSPAGVIVASRTAPQPFTAKQIELLTTFADQAVIAIENVRLFDEVQTRSRELSESLEQQTATSEVLGVISRSPGELEPVFEAILANATRLCEASYGTLWLCEGDAFRSVALHGAVPPAYAAERQRRDAFRPGPGTALARVANTRQTVQIADLRAGEGYLSGDPVAVAAVEMGGIRTLVAVPMLKQDELIGAFAIYRHEVSPFTDKQIGLVTNFAAQAVIAIENARLLNELRESLEQQTATADVLKVISRSKFELQPVLNTLVQSAAQLCESEQNAIFLRDGDVYRIAARHGLPPELEEYARQHPISPGRNTLTGRVALECRVIHIPDVLADPEYNYGAQPIAGYRALLGVPLLREGSCIGVMTISRPTPKPFTTKQIELVTTFADQAVIAIENVRLFDEVQTRTRELSQSVAGAR
jgi:two-component system, NtrC family, sensor kinase